MVMMLQLQAFEVSVEVQFIIIGTCSGVLICLGLQYLMGKIYEVINSKKNSKSDTSTKENILERKSDEKGTKENILTNKDLDTKHSAYNMDGYFSKIKKNNCQNKSTNRNNKKNTFKWSTEHKNIKSTAQKNTNALPSNPSVQMSYNNNDEISNAVASAFNSKKETHNLYDIHGNMYPALEPPYTIRAVPIDQHIAGMSLEEKILNGSPPNAWHGLYHQFTNYHYINHPVHTQMRLAFLKEEAQKRGVKLRLMNRIEYYNKLSFQFLPLPSDVRNDTNNFIVNFGTFRGYSLDLTLINDPAANNYYNWCLNSATSINIKSRRELFLQLARRLMNVLYEDEEEILVLPWAKALMIQSITDRIGGFPWV